jgi:predicted transcriptional regulator
VLLPANESPADQLIPYHHELAQSKSHPYHIMFYCDKPADKGGETPICLSHLVYQQIQIEFPDFIEEIAAKVNSTSQVVYITCTISDIQCVCRA